MNRSYTCARCQNGCRPTIQAHLNGDCVSRSSTHECNFAGYDFRVGLHRDLNLKVTRCFYLRVPCMVLFCFVNRVERISHMYFLDVLFEGTCYHGCLLFAASALNFQAFCLNAPRGQVVGSYGKEKIKNIKQHAKTWRLNGPWMRYSRLSTQRWTSTLQPSLHMLLRRVASVSSFPAYLLSSFIYHNLLKAPQTWLRKKFNFSFLQFLAFDQCCCDASGTICTKCIDSYVYLPHETTNMCVRMVCLLVEMELQPEIHRIHILAYGFVQRAWIIEGMALGASMSFSYVQSGSSHLALRLLCN